jgi:hypothetical protein
MCGHLILNRPFDCLHCMVVHACKCVTNLNPLYPGQYRD